MEQNEAREQSFNQAPAGHDVHAVKPAQEYGVSVLGHQDVPTMIGKPNTDFTEKFFVRWEKTEDFPFLLTKLSPYYESLNLT